MFAAGQRWLAAAASCIFQHLSPPHHTKTAKSAQKSAFCTSPNVRNRMEVSHKVDPNRTGTNLARKLYRKWKMNNFSPFLTEK